MKNVKSPSVRGTVFCTENKFGKLDFFYSDGIETYMLFVNKNIPSVKEFFSKELPISKAMDKSSAFNDKNILKVQTKLPKWLRYIEQLEGIVVLDKTARQGATDSSKHSALRKGSVSTCKAMSEYSQEYSDDLFAA